MSNSTMNVIKRAALSAAMLSAAVASSAVFSNAASAQSVKAQTNINFSVKPFVRLYYKDSVNITLSPKPDAQAISQESFSMDVTYSPDSKLNGSADVGVKANVENAAEGTITLKNFWAMQSIAPKGTRITVSADDQKAEGPNGSTITVAGIKESGEYEPTGLASAQYGDVKLTVDMTNAKNSGDYKGAVINLVAENF